MSTEQSMPSAALGTGEIIGWVVLRHDPTSRLYCAEGPFTDWPAVSEECERQARELADAPRPQPWVTILPLYRGTSGVTADEDTPMPGDPFALPEPPVDTVLRVSAGGAWEHATDLVRLADGWAWLETDGTPVGYRMAYASVLAISAAERITVVRWGATAGRAA